MSESVNIPRDVRCDATAGVCTMKGTSMLIMVAVVQIPCDDDDAAASSRWLKKLLLNPSAVHE